MKKTTTNNAVQDLERDINYHLSTGWTVAGIWELVDRPNASMVRTKLFVVTYEKEDE